MALAESLMRQRDLRDCVWPPKLRLLSVPKCFRNGSLKTGVLKFLGTGYFVAQRRIAHGGRAWWAYAGAQDLWDSSMKLI